MEVFKTLVNGNQIGLEDLSKENLLAIVKKQEEKISQYKNINETQRKTIESHKTQIHDLQKNKTETDKVYKRLAKAEQTIQEKNEEIDRYKVDSDNKSKKIKGLLSRIKELSIDNKKKNEKIENLESEISQFSHDCDNFEWLTQSNEICELMGKSTDGWSNIPGDTLHDVKILLEENKELKAELNKLEETGDPGDWNPYAALAEELKQQEKRDAAISLEIKEMIKHKDKFDIQKKERLLQFLDERMKWTSKKLIVRDPGNFRKLIPVAYSSFKNINDYFKEWLKNQENVISSGKDKNIPTEKEMKKLLEKWHKERFPSDKEWIQNDKPWPYSQNGSYNTPRFNLKLKNISDSEQANWLRHRGHVPEGEAKVEGN